MDEKTILQRIDYFGRVLFRKLHNMERRIMTEINDINAALDDSDKAILDVADELQVLVNELNTSNPTAGQLTNLKVRIAAQAQALRDSVAKAKATDPTGGGATGVTGGTGSESVAGATGPTGDASGDGAGATGGT